MVALITIYIYYIFVTLLYDGCCFMGMASLDNLVKCESSSVATTGPCESRTEPHLLCCALHILYTVDALRPNLLWISKQDVVFCVFDI